ncbi:archease [Maribacter sp. CXY002]|uniref:archease n=1 Tax=Maribacter luteocoastalis TaxID=3407671 RepID=UPI003B678226
MENHTKPRKISWKPRSGINKSNTVAVKNKEIIGSTFQNLFEKSLKQMSKILKPGACDELRHSNCVMEVTVNGDTPEELMVNFLNRILKWTYLHQTIFCYMNVKELTDSTLVAQVFGVWYHALDQKIKHIKNYGFTRYRNVNGIWKSTIVLEFEMD